MQQNKRYFVLVKNRAFRSLFFQRPLVEVFYMFHKPLSTVVEIDWKIEQSKIQIRVTLFTSMI
jgi:hypothetical protein